MSDTQHPITPPPGLVQQWAQLPLSVEEILVVAAQWGADQELEACLDQLRRWGVHGTDQLFATRRPKPTSLKERLSQAIVDGDERLALKLLEQLND